MTIKRINEFPDGDGSLSNDDVFLFMDNPSGSGVTKKISLSDLANMISSGAVVDTFDAAVEWTSNHTIANGTRYLANDLVYQSGRLYKANYDNESIPVSNTLYWTDVGDGYRLNIDGRDIANIPYPVNNVIAGTGINVTDNDGTYTISHDPTYNPQASSLATTVFNETGSTIPKFTAVYINGGHGDQPTITKAQANSEATSSKTYGITAENIDHMSTGKVVVFGALTGVDTDQFNPTAPTGDINGTTLWLSPTTAGGFTTTKPSAPYHMVAMGTVVRTHQNEGIVEVRVQNGFEIEELHNVAISGVAHNDILVYNSGTSLWENNSTGVFSNPSGITGASVITNIVQISQTDYDNLSSYDPNTVYIINT